MKIRFLKDHGFNKKDSETEAEDQAANYLIRVGVAEGVTEPVPLDEAKEFLKETFTLVEPDFVEKVEHKPMKEKKENKTGNVPTAKKKKK